MTTISSFSRIRLNSIRNFDEDSKILFVIREALHAKSEDTAVTMEQIIGKGIELGITEDYFTDNWEGYKKGDHTWWTKIAPMSGIGTRDELSNHEVSGLHRKKVQRQKGNRKTNVMMYWFDPSVKHTVLLKSGKPKKKRETETVYDKSMLEKIENCRATPSEYVMIGEKKISINWMKNNPEKAKVLYGYSL